MNRYVCIHGHFYQPPRENPWLEAVEPQDSAYPYHDWNQRITAECYGPNAASRILDHEGRIDRIVNNYARISFDFGPTLLSWLEVNEPEVYRAVLEADRDSRERFGGHGCALAQAHSHLILPLASARDKRTQVLWGLADFEHRFGRRAEGMWLPETAVDLESLELLAAAGVTFTVLEPRQALRVRPPGGDWLEVGPAGAEPTRPYRVDLPSGGSIAVFFYDGGVSRGIAFEGLLASGEALAGHLLGSFTGEDRPQIVHVATDGETYGHHHRYGEMALSFALAHVEGSGRARLTNYGELLERHPPQWQAEIRERTSWSCAHGIERWRSDCGCRAGGEAGWTQAWRAPLRAALDWLRDELAPRYERAAAELFADPWAARDGYVEVLLDRSRAGAFLERQAGRPLAPADGAERIRALRLLELQRHAMLMYTSCGWFFNDLAGIETVQVLRYAGRAVHLAEQLFGDALEEGFLERLEQARSNRPEAGDGRRIYERQVRPARVELPQVTAHYAVSSLFEDYPRQVRIHGFSVEREDHRVFEAGRARLLFGRARVTSAVTSESMRHAYGVLHFGDHNLNAGVRALGEDGAYEQLVEEAGRAFQLADFPRVIRLLDGYFGTVPYSLKSLFRDEQRRVLDLVLASTLAEVESELREIHRRHTPLMRFLAQLDVAVPKVFRAAAELVLDRELRRAFGDPAADFAEVRRNLDEAAALGLELDAPGLSYALEQALERMMERLRERPDEPGLLERLDEAAALAATPPFKVDLWRVQNLYYEMLERQLPDWRERAGEDWAERFRALGERLWVRTVARGLAPKEISGTPTRARR